jgi:flagellar basal body-associated protein FliL
MSNRLAEISAATRLIGEEGSALIIAIFVMLRVLLVVGALGFMWQVRHAKTERPS